MVAAAIPHSRKWSVLGLHGMNPKCYPVRNQFLENSSSTLYRHKFFEFITSNNATLPLGTPGENRFQGVKKINEKIVCRPAWQTFSLLTLLNPNYHLSHSY